MSFEKGDTVVLHEKHSDYDGEEGEITQTAETMFGDVNYTISFEDGQEAGVPEDSLDLVAEADDDDDAEADAE
ncbi:MULTISPECIES: DUF1918 domain-containing protein [Halobacterium]|uniref:DUF1918 domain-containing protein n=1 Tax=Halobacterium TaxID=2239 RepID=UPI0019653CE2|nr:MULTISPECIES: DUF1918 domain-containing protein [Halobacterium]MCF2165147.1 DUF1918 domain-containing protein [Halobacterium salinarum]MCF2168044.1 DUF1918 domain-containing protein [Halobacterium salinarum]MCF2239708.1 DUF1918 domain-containing protein [Halobacterium salinarum]QRY23687.1 DUF1918 domain-containing protein [Halobacterium sp. GSL-19]WJK63105.1 DUF1918 domain-containing protein [Halobacterium salinarum]